MLKRLSLVGLFILLSCAPKEGYKTKYFGVHLRLGEVWDEKLKLAEDLGFNTIVIWDIFWKAESAGDVPSKKIDRQKILELARAIERVKSYGFRAVVKIHTLPGKVGLKGKDARYSWWMGFHFGGDAWLDGYWDNILKDVALCAKRADALVIGNELYSLCVHTEAWSKLIDKTRRIYKGKVVYASFFTSPIVEDKIWLIRLAKMFYGSYGLFRKVTDSIGEGRFRFETEEMEREVAKRLLSHRNKWREKLHAVGVNIYFPVWWYRSTPTVDGYKKAYVDALLWKWGPFRFRLNYWNATRSFAGRKPLWITEFWVSDEDPDWGEPGHAKEIFTAFMDFWRDKAEAIFLWEGPTFWKSFIEEEVGQNINGARSSLPIFFSFRTYEPSENRPTLSRNTM